MMKIQFIGLFLLLFISSIVFSQDIAIQNVQSTSVCNANSTQNITIDFDIINNSTLINQAITVSFYYGNPFTQNATKVYQNSYAINLNMGGILSITDSIKSPTGTSGNLFIIINDLGTQSIPFTMFTPSFNETNYINNVDSVLVNSCPEICFDGIDNDNNGITDCYDSSCACNQQTGQRHPHCVNFFIGNCDPTCSVTPPPPIIDAVQLWQTTGINMDARQAPSIGDIDNDGVTEVIGRNRSGIYIFNGQTGALKNSNTTMSIIDYLDAIAYADVDNDGTAELFVVNRDFSISRLEHDLTITWKQAANTLSTIRSGSGVAEFSPGIADFNGDGTPELYVGNIIINTTNGNVIARGGNNNKGHQRSNNGNYLYPSVYDILPSSFCVDCDGLELIAGSQIYAVNITNGTMTVIQNAQGVTSDGFTSIADMDNDGDADIVFSYVESRRSRVHIWDGQTPNVISSYISSRLNTDNISLPTISDFDGDGFNEISVCVNRQYDLIEDVVTTGVVGSAKWVIATSDNSGFTGSTVYDFNGDGIAEVVYRDETQLRILNGPNGTTLFSIPCSSFTRTEYPIVADVNNDGETEIVCACGNNIVAFESNSLPWIPARSVWNQFMYNITNIDDNLSVPRFPTKNHFNPRLNNYLNQAPILGNGPLVHRVSVPDVSCAIQRVIPPQAICKGETALIEFEVCNNGSEVVRDIPWALYSDNPTINASAQIIFYDTIKTQLVIGSCILDTVSYTILNHGLDSTELFLIVNVSDTLQPIFSLDTSFFPNTRISECNYENNIDSISLYFDTTSPTSICKDTLITLPIGGVYTIDESYINKGSSDLCGIETTLLSQYIFNCGDRGVNIVTLTNIDSNGNSSACQANVTVVDTMPIADAGIDTNLCNVYSINLYAQTINSSFSANWIQLSGPSNIIFSNSTEEHSNISNLQEGDYSLLWTVTNNTCDTVFDTLHIHFFNQPIANAGPDDSLCNIFSYTFNANMPAGSTIGSWNEGQNNPNQVLFSSTIQNNAIITGLMEGTYEFYWTLTNGNCTPSTDTIILEVYNQPIANVEMHDSLCGSKVYDLLANQPLGRAKAQWSQGSSNPNQVSFSNVNQYNTNISGLIEGKYEFIWTILNGNCPSSLDTIELYNYPNPVSSFFADKTEICLNECIQLNATNSSINNALSSEISSYTWMINANSIFQNDSIVDYCFYHKADTFDISLITTSNHGCMDTLTISDYIVVNPLPIAQIGYTNNIELELYDKIRISDVSYDNITSRMFDINSSFTSTDSTFLYLFEDSGVFVIRLKVENIYNCIDSTEVLLNIKEKFNVFVPNAFSPNGDNINDEFLPILRSVEANEYSLKIFSRWGGLIFETNDINTSWDGTNGGSLVNTGSYIWQISYREKDRVNAQTIRGHVIVLY